MRERAISPATLLDLIGRGEAPPVLDPSLAICLGACLVRLARFRS